jgi:hypothetical protein
MSDQYGDSGQQCKKKSRNPFKKHKHRRNRNRTDGDSTTTASTDASSTGGYGTGEYYDMAGDQLSGRDMRSYEEQEEYSQKTLQAKANVQWEKLELICTKTLTKEDLGRMLESGNSAIEFRLGNGMTFGERTCAPDFVVAAVDKKGRPLARPKSLDIIQGIVLEDIHAPGLDSEMTTISTNIERFESEGFPGESKFVTKTLLTSQLTNMKQKRIVLLDRHITNHTMIFQSENLGMTPEKMRAGIKAMDDHWSAVDINSPMLGLYNKLHPNNKILEATPNMGDRVRMRTKTAEKYAAKTERQMKDQISYANITSGDGLVIRFERAVPQSKLERHQEYVRSKKTGSTQVGEPYLPFASSFDATGRQEKELKVEFRAVVWYLKGDKEVDLAI